MRAGLRGAARATALVLVLAACSPTDESPGAGETSAGGPSASRPASTPSAPATPSAAPTGTADAGPGPADRGHEVVEPRHAVRHDTGLGAELELTVEGVEVRPTCPGRAGEVEARLGQFVVLDVVAALGPASSSPSSPDDAFVALTPDVFTVAAPDGRVQEIVVTDEAWACYDDADLLPPFVDPGQRVVGKVVLESVTEHGWVIYAPEGTTGWEWRF